MVNADEYMRNVSKTSIVLNPSRMLSFFSDPDNGPVTILPNLSPIAQDRVNEEHYMDAIEILADTDFNFINVQHETNMAMTFKIHDYKRAPPQKLSTVKKRHIKGSMFCFSVVPI